MWTYTALIGHAQPVWARSGHETGRRLSLFLLGGREKAMHIALRPRARAIEVSPHDLARRVDPDGYGVRGAIEQVSWKEVCPG
jgi:hypothetical protein